MTGRAISPFWRGTSDRIARHALYPPRLHRLILVAPVLLAACALPARETTTGPDGQAQITLRNGLTCHANQCLRIDAQRGTVELPGHEPVQVLGVDLSAESLSAEDFVRLLRAAQLAPGLGGGEDVTQEPEDDGEPVDII